MAKPEQEPSRGLKDGIIRSVEVITVGFAVMGALVTGANVIEGDYLGAARYGSSAAVWSLIAGGIFAAEKYFKRNVDSNRPGS